MTRDTQSNIIPSSNFPLRFKQELDGTRAYQEANSNVMSVVNAHLNKLPVKFSFCVSEDLLVT